MKYAISDGGRADAGFQGTTGDCAVRAVSIATGTPYKEVYDKLYALQGKTPRKGVGRKHVQAYLDELGGWKWIPTMGIGTGCKVHLKADELPSGTLIVRLSRHVAAVINHTVYDNHDPQRDGTRCVYGYWHLESAADGGTAAAHDMKTNKPYPFPKHTADSVGC